MLRSTCGIGLAAMNPSFLLFDVMAGDDAGDILRLVDVAEVAAHVGGVLAFLIQAPAVQEGDVLELARLLEDVGVEVAERGGKHHRRPVEVDHALHRLLNGHGLRDHLFLADLHARQLGQRRRALGVGLVVAVVGLRTDVDEADGEGRRGRVGDIVSRAVAPHAQDDGGSRDPRETIPDRAEGE